MLPNVHYNPEHTNAYLSLKLTVRCILALAAQFKLHLAHLDAFTH